MIRSRKQSVIWCCVLLSMIAPAILVSQEAPPVTLEELFTFIDLETDLKSIHQSINAGEIVPTDRYYFLTGTVTAISTLDPDPAAFYSEVDFINAAWIDGQIESFGAILVFLDGSFASRLPQRRSRDPAPDEITPNSRGMVVAEYFDAVEGADGQLLPVFIASFYKNLD